MRFSSAASSNLLAACFRATQGVPDIAPSWNIRPGSQARVIRGGTDHAPRSLDLLCWGLVPGFVKSARSRSRLATIPADRVAISRTTKASFGARRCLIPVTSIYELLDRPCAVESAERAVLALAGIWDVWLHPVTHQAYEAFAIVTVPQPEAAPDQPAAPLVIRPEHWSDWLGETGAGIRHLLTAPQAEKWRRWSISRRVLNPDEDNPDLLAHFSHAQDAVAGFSHEEPHRTCC